MRNAPSILSYGLIFIGLYGPPASAQETVSGVFKLPSACEKAIEGSTSTMNGDTMEQSIGNHMSAAQNQMMKAMTGMVPPMMQSMTIGDVDVAFACSMITHHKGAIAMAKVQVSQGKDAQMKAMAQRPWRKR